MTTTIDINPAACAAYDALMVGVQASRQFGEHVLPLFANAAAARAGAADAVRALDALMASKAAHYARAR